MYEYKIGLALVKNIGVNDKGLDERKAFIISQIKIFNEKSTRSLINPKHIGLGEKGEDDIQLTKTTLVVTLYTQEILNTPGKAVRLLSQLLINSEEPDNLSDLLLDKKLFRSFKAATTDEIDGSESIIDLSAFSDADLIKALVDFACDRQDFSAKKRSAVDQMKKIAIENGLLTIAGTYRK